MEENRYLKKYGQNFLTNDYIAKEIAKQIPNDIIDVLEIGPGDGFLTKELIQNNRKLTCVEIDDFYVNKLQKKFPSINIINSNILKVDISKYSAIAGNIPYNITSSILIKLVLNTKNDVKIVLMIQKDAYERIIECKSKNERTAVSNLIKTRFSYEKVLDVSKNNFFPKPNVDSTVFTLFNNESSYIKDYKNYYDFLLMVFASKRKTLYNNLTRKYDKSLVDNILIELQIGRMVRPEDLETSQLVNLYLNIEGRK